MTNLTNSECPKGQTALSMFAKCGLKLDVLSAFISLLNGPKPFAFVTPATSNPFVGQTPTSAYSSALQINRPSPDSPAPLTAELLNGGSAEPGLMNTLKVLITDDSKALRERLTDMLTQVEGVEIVGTAATISEAFAAIHKHRPDVLVLDLQIGTDNGIEILRSTKVAFPQVKVIVFTNHAEPQYRERCADLGADHFLCKSTDSNLLIETVQELIERPQP